MKNIKSTKSEIQSSLNSIAFKRRDFLKSIGLLAGGLVASRLSVMAGPFQASELQGAVPIDKKLNEAWVKSLYERGTPTIYKGAELNYIGMPIGGIYTGQIYLGGDGRLWHWDIFNQTQATGDHNFAYPPLPDFPLEQGFSITIGDKTKAIDRTGFANVSFKGQYPIGEVTYQDDTFPVEIKLEAFSPFIPLSSDDSGLPAVVMQFTVKNSSGNPVEANLSGLLENAVLVNNRSVSANRINKVIDADGFTFLECSAEKEQTSGTPQPDKIFEDWNTTTYTNWTAEGTAFGSGPIKKSDIPTYQGDVGGDTDRVVNSHATAPGSTVEQKDSATGKLISSVFIIDRNYINFWIGGGAHEGLTCMNLIVDGNVARSMTGKDNNRMTLQSFNVKELAGKQAHLEIIDSVQGGWGNIGIGKITFSDISASSNNIEGLPDYGSMGLALLGTPAELTENSKPTASLNEKSTGSLGRKLSLSAGESAKVTFLITWFFPNLVHDISSGRYYSNQFDSAQSVAKYISVNFERLSSATQLWRDTWYDSTLPFWFLDRTFVNTSTMATSTCFRYKNGRFWAWEGVGCCPGTCTHVWHYAQAMARIFPDIERDLRQRVDLGLALNTQTGISGFRAEYDMGLAIDGQAGTILRIYREHLMSADESFLKNNWSKIKLMFNPLFIRDSNSDGLLEGDQMNTLDRQWFGKISWLSSMYLAALRAGEAMAMEMGETDFSNRCLLILAKGTKNMDAQLFNGEYYYQEGAPGRTNEVGSYDGCEIDQMLGQSWAFQVGLDRVLTEKNTKTALNSLWKYNFALDAGAYRVQQGSGRVYAMEGEAGLLMCSWPKGDSKRVKVSYDFYFNECMTGFEHQVAGHMIWEGMLEKGLAITRAIHDRYHASKRNPWNEVECGDHYGRAMASYGTFLAVCGFQHHGPKAMIGFAPRITPEDFKSAFTSAEGWGIFTQTRISGTQYSKIQMKYGQLRLKTLRLELGSNINTGSVKIILKSGGEILQQTHQMKGSKLVVTIVGIPVVIPENSEVEAEIQFYSATSLLDNKMVSIFPNPTSGEVTVTCMQVPEVITIFDMKGNQLLTHRANAEITLFDFSIYAKGIYLVTVQMEHLKTSSKLILI